MQTSRVIVLTLLMLPGMIASAPVPREQELRHPGTIESVTVFSDRALVVRKRSVQLSEETVRLRFSSLPATFQAEGLRATAEGMEIAGLSVHPATVAADSEIEAAKVRLESITKELRAETDAQSTITEQIKLLDSLAKGTTERSDREMREGEMHVKSWADALHFLEEQRSGYQDRLRGVEERRAKLQLSAKEASDELARLTNSRRRAGVEVEVLCKGKAGSSGTVRLSYIVTTVSWDSIYDLHGSPEAGEFLLESLATVRQNTGEDWSHAKITLSTARPSLAIAPPMLKPWQLRAGGSTGRVEMQNRANQEEDGVQSADRRPEEPSTESAGDQSTFSAELPGSPTITSGGSDHRLTVHAATVQGKLSHVVVPGRSSSVFLFATIKNTTGRPIFNHRVNVFLDGGFIGTTAFEGNASPGEDATLFLGPDQRMHVRRMLVKGEIVGSGLINKAVEIENRWQIEVSNASKKPRTVLVHDQIPVSADPRISTRFLGSSVGDVKPDARGLLHWTLDVGPGEKRTVDFGYSMQIPQDLWEAMQQQADQERQRRGINDSPAAPAPAQERKKYDLEKMFYK